MSKNQLLILLHHVLFLIAIPIYGFNPYWAIGLVIGSIIWARVINGQIMHQHFAHKTYKDGIMNYILTFVVLFTSISSILSFVASHRQHHKFCDTEKDPHSPTHIGRLNVYFLNWKRQRISPSLFRDVALNKFQKFMNQHWILLHLIIIGILAMINPIIVCFGVSLVVVTTFHLAGLGNVIGHLNGEPRNSLELILTHGSAWKHADHHQA